MRQSRLPTPMEVYNEFHDLLGVPMAVAGGCLRDFFLHRPPKDFDVFTFEPYDRRLLADYEKSQRVPGGYDACHVRNVIWRGQEIQIVGPKYARNAEELLDTFDWNICQFAFAGQEVISRMDIGDIRPGGELRLMRCSNAVSTLRRGYDFQLRYGMTMTPEAAHSLTVRSARTHEEFLTTLRRAA